MFGTKHKKHSYADIFEGMLIGGALASAAVLLFGTKKGKEIQKELVHKYKQLCHKTEGMRAKFGKLVTNSAAKKHKRVARSKHRSRNKI